MKTNYRDRMLAARDPRYAKIAGAIYGTRDLKAAPAPAVPAVDDMAELRAEYERVMGKRPFMGWDADMLRTKMAAAAQS